MAEFIFNTKTAGIEAQISTVLRLSECRYCGSPKLKLTPGKGSHRAQVKCVACARHLKWVGAEDLAKINVICQSVRFDLRIESAVKQLGLFDQEVEA